LAAAGRNLLHLPNMMSAKLTLADAEKVIDRILVIHIMILSGWA